MSFDTLRQALAIALNTAPAHRAALEAQFGQVWDPEDLRRDFEVLGFAAPLVVVRRRADGRRGSLYFQHSPRFYFAFKEDRPATGR